MLSKAVVSLMTLPAFYPFHHLADIAQASFALRISDRALTIAEFLFHLNLLQDRRTAISHIVRLNIFSGIVETVAYDVGQWFFLSRSQKNTPASFPSRIFLQGTAGIAS